MAKAEPSNDALERLGDRLAREFELRSGLLGLWARLRQHTAPARMAWYSYLGGALLLFFAVQAVSGVLLLFYYQPSPAAAHASIEQLMGEVRFGWIVRGLHYWASHAMVAALLLHLARVFFTASFKRPRELTWMLGVALLVVVLGFAFTGYLLPWDQTAYWGTTVGTSLTEQAPWVGAYLKAVLRGGRQVGAATLERFYAMHVVVLPAAMLVLLGGHLALVWKHGPSETGKWRGAQDRRLAPFFPVQARKEAALACVVMALLLLWVAWRPAPLGLPADALHTPDNVKPAWYFLSSYQMLKYVPSFNLPAGLTTFQLAVGVQVLPFLLLLFWPFIERSPECSLRRRLMPMSLACLAIVIVALLTYPGVYAGGTEPIFGIDIS